MVWQKGREMLDQETSFPAEYRVEQESATFVIRVDNENAEMALVTMLPPKK